MGATAEPFVQRTLKDCNHQDVFHIQNSGTQRCIALKSHAEESGRTELRAIMETCDDVAKRQQWTQIAADFLVRSHFDSSKCLFPSKSSIVALVDCEDENWMDASWEKYSDKTIRNTDHEDDCWDEHHGKYLVLSECVANRQEQLWTSFSSDPSCPDTVIRDKSRAGNTTDSTNNTNIASTDNSTDSNSWFNPQAIEDHVNALGPWGIYYFGLVYVAFVTVCIPAVPLTITAGYLFGIWKGFAVVWISAGTAAALSFTIGRTLLRSYVLRKLEGYPTFKKLDKALGNEGFRVMFLIQISPFFPFSMGNYFYATTSINFWSFWFGTLLGICPESFVYCYSGHVGQTLLGDASGMIYPWYVYILFLLVSIVILHLLVTTVNRIVEEMNEEEEEVDNEHLEKLTPVT
ncbi:unnamed protein product [Cylindrotheca closterium]|uniref:Uncharacterized protein n=1 Tax=Cylindrotheca closterium TaxID=2856 RepID=A0AAD2FUG9_9STRA|nr:unnamed protein product [Cylindrotheca closterium]